jgi:hypothetical protein
MELSSSFGVERGSNNPSSKKSCGMLYVASDLDEFFGNDCKNIKIIFKIKLRTDWDREILVTIQFRT